MPKLSDTKSDKYEPRENVHDDLIEKPEYRNLPGHHTGAGGHGYERNPDGTYSISPDYRRQIDQIASERAAVYALLDHIQEHAESRLATLQVRQSEWFARVARNLYREDDVNRMTYFGDGIVGFKDRDSAKAKTSRSANAGSRQPANKPAGEKAKSKKKRTEGV